MTTEADESEIGRLETRVEKLEKKIKTFTWVGSAAFGVIAFACFFTFLYAVVTAFASIARNGVGH